MEFYCLGRKRRDKKEKERSATKYVVHIILDVESLFCIFFFACTTLLFFLRTA